MKGRSLYRTLVRFHVCLAAQIDLRWVGADLMADHVGCDIDDLVAKNITRRDSDFNPEIMAEVPRSSESP